MVFKDHLFKDLTNEKKKPILARKLKFRGENLVDAFFEKREKNIEKFITILKMV
jgi:hypothetical protein